LPDSIRGLRVLVVDTHATSRLVLRKQLTHWGCRHAEANTAEQAMRLLQDASETGEPFLVALLDKSINDTSGETLGLQIKNHPKLAATHLVMMTSMGNRGDAHRLEQMGFSAYLTKPVKQTRLYECLLAIMGCGPYHQGRLPAHILTAHSLPETIKQSIRILLVEDNSTNQMVALRILEKAGYRADAVWNGLEAIDALSKGKYDLILMDVQMPQLDGYETARRIRQAENASFNPDIPIIAMTAHAMKGDEEKCLRAGMNGYLVKPINPAALFEAIGKHLSLRVPTPEKMSGTKTKAEPPAFDREIALKRAADDENILRQVIAVFLEDAPEQLAALGLAVEQNNMDAVKRRAHALKSAAGSVGAIAMFTAALEIERLACGEDGAEIEKKASLLGEMFVQFKEATGK